MSTQSVWKHRRHVGKADLRPCPVSHVVRVGTPSSRSKIKSLRAIRCFRCGPEANVEGHQEMGCASDRASRRRVIVQKRTIRSQRKTAKGYFRDVSEREA